jgi:hypothetical protein
VQPVLCWHLFHCYHSPTLLYSVPCSSIFFIVFSGKDNFLLTLMAYDHFVALCQPLNYMVIMSTQFCGLMILVSWIIMFWVSLIHIL